MVEPSRPAIFLPPGWLTTTFRFDNWRGFIGSMWAQSLIPIKRRTADPGKSLKSCGPHWLAADITATVANPLENANALKRVSFVMKNGVEFKRGE
ncbi:MAG: hypothetical protein M3R52_05005 [Acidobacteriota bacterium]|nr:hypothetical protein [Acidobacteriota bacterium]